MKRNSISLSLTLVSALVLSFVTVACKGQQVLERTNKQIQMQEPMVTATDITQFKSILSNKRMAFGTYISIRDINLAPPRPKNYLTEISKYFNLYTFTATWLTSEGKGQGIFDFSASDKVVEFAKANNAKIKGHALVFGTSLPDWLVKGNFTPSQLKDILKNHVQTMVKHYKDKYPGAVQYWNVVNEPVCNGGLVTNANENCTSAGIKTNIWTVIHKPGSNDPTDYIKYAFEWARAADPDAKLFLNDNNVEGTGSTAKFNRLYQLVKNLKDAGTPIDGVGFESHIRLSDISRYDVKVLTDRLNRLADLGLETQISEFDVAMNSQIVKSFGGSPSSLLPIANPGSQDVQNQAQLYKIFLQAAMQSKNCTAFVTWGPWDAGSWTQLHWKGSFYPHLLDNDMKPKLPFKYMLDQARSYKSQ